MSSSAWWARPRDPDLFWRRKTEKSLKSRFFLSKDFPDILPLSFSFLTRPRQNSEYALSGKSLARGPIKINHFLTLPDLFSSFGQKYCLSNKFLTVKKSKIDVQENDSGLIFCEDVSNEKEKLISKLTHALHNSIRLIRVQPPFQILILLSAFSKFFIEHYSVGLTLYFDSRMSKDWAKGRKCED